LTSDPFDRFTGAINQRIYPKTLAKRIPPTQSLRARSPFLPQQNKQSSPGSTLCAWRQQPEIASGVAVTIRDVVRPQGNELLDRIPGWNCPFQFFVLRQKLDFSLCHLYETTLSDGWPPDISRYVSQEMLL
jgi:hypothetical protein